MAKIKVLVLYGGNSTEHEVSCRSAAYVLKNLDPSKYDVNAVAITKTGQWLPQDVPKLLSGDPKIIPIDSQRPAVTGQQALAQGETVVFPVIHGTNGEDGSLQGLMDLAGVAYVGADTLGSSIGMDKVVSKRLAAGAGVPIVPYCELKKQFWDSRADTFINQCDQELGYPMFVKPAKLGSSVGVTKVKSRDQLRQACELAFRFDERLLVEKAVDAREIECAVLGDHEPLVSEVGEIRMNAAEFYDYEAKYESESGADIIIPADITAQQKEQVHELAKKIFSALELYGMARIDLFLDRNTGELFFNEVNTIPGFTSISQYPLLWQASGFSAAELLDRLIEVALKRHEMRRGLQRSKS